MKRRHREVLCDRARAWAALAPDGELSDLEQKLLDAHVARCARCERFAAEVASVTTALRAERLEPLSQPLTISSRRRRTGVARLGTVGAVAAVALMTIGITARAPLPSDERDSVPLPRVTNFSNDTDIELAQILRAQGAGLGDAGVQPGRQGLREPL